MTMISWHKVGQAVTPIDDAPWDADDDAPIQGPAFGEVHTVIEVEFIRFRRGPREVFLTLAKWPENRYAACDFRPVYPQAVEELRRLCLNVPEHADA